MATANKVPRRDSNGTADKPSAVNETDEILQKIEDVQNEIDQLNEKASVDILTVERRYVKLRQPHFKRRAEVIKSVPSFWATVLVNHDRLSEVISESDEEALLSLEKLEVEEFDDIKSGYKIDFHFHDNPYFANKCLTKEFRLSESGELVSKSTEISWKPGKRLVPPSSSTGKPTQKRSQEPETFFRWFVDGNGIEFGGDEIGEIIKDDIWPNPLQYFMAEGNGTFEDSEDFENTTFEQSADNTEDFEDEEGLEEDDEDVEHEEYNEEN